MNTRAKKPRCSPTGEKGVAVIVVLVILAILFLYIAANARSLHYLGREIKLVEQQQLRRLARGSSGTNVVQNPGFPQAPSPGSTGSANP